MNTKIFSYKVPGITLEPSGNDLQISPTFDRKTVLDPLKEIFGKDNYKIDETTVSYKLIDCQLHIQGLAVENEAPKAVGFQFGKGS